MPLGMHKDSLLNLVELAAKAENEEKNKARHEQQAGISSTETNNSIAIKSNSARHFTSRTLGSGAFGMPRSSSFGNENHRKAMYGEGIEENADEQVARDYLPHEEAVANSIKLASDEEDGATVSTIGSVEALENRNNSSSMNKNRTWQDEMYGMDLENYYDPYAATSSATNKQLLTSRIMASGNSSSPSNCFCIFAPWGANKHRSESDDSSELGEDEETTPADEQAQLSKPKNSPMIKAKSLGSGSASPKLEIHVDDQDDEVKEDDQEDSKIEITPKRNITGVIVLPSGNSQRDRLLKATLEQVHQLHASQTSECSSNSPLQRFPSPAAGMLKELPPSASCRPPEKGILKKQVMQMAETGTNTLSPTVNGQSRRSIFAAKAATSKSKFSVGSLAETLHVSAGRKSVRFAPTARVATIPSRNSLSLFDRSLIWWTRSDYESFKKTGRMIARAILEGGSHIWLQSQFTREEKRKYEDEEKKSGSGSDDETSPTEEAFGDKWWCKFGHSRRGLEHIANMEEGRLRQQSVQNAMEAVMKEQRKQKISSDCPDPYKLARVSQQYTRWAKELAILAGLGDAEAVRTNFQKNNAPIKSRSKMTRTSMYTSYLTRNFNFIGDVVEKDSRSCWNPGVLDEHTSSSLLVKLNDEYHMHTLAEAGPSSIGEQKHEAQQSITLEASPSHDFSEDNFEEKWEPIHDPKTSGTVLSKKAAGLGQGENDFDRFLEKRFESVRSTPVPQA